MLICSFDAVQCEEVYVEDIAEDFANAVPDDDSEDV